MRAVYPFGVASKTVDPGVAAVLADVGPEAARLDVAAWLRELRSSAEAGERLDRTRVSALEQAGARAASDGIALPLVIDAWLTAGWVLWRDVESGRRTVEALLRALDDGAKALSAGFVREQRSAVRRDESARAVLLDDLLGEAPVDDVLQAAERAGVDVGRERAVLVVATTTEAVLDRLRDAGALAAPRQGTVVAVLDGGAPRGPERAGLGRPGAGVAGIRRSYREACSALQVAHRLDLNGVVPYVEVLPEALLLQDRAGLEALVGTALGPLDGGRLSAELLIATLDAYFRENGNVAATARRLGIHERTAVYRIGRIEALTGLRLDDGDDRFRLELAVRARALL
jgi:DNA-binding PucR family transcriptional regulator